MSRRGLGGWLLVAAMLAPGCLGPGEFHCTSHDQCGVGGLCEPSGYCSVGDKTCGSGRRYARYAAPALSGQCVGDACPDDPIAELRAGATHSCILRHGGTVWCWGDNADGQLGDGTTTPRSTAVQVQGLTAAVAVAVGQQHSCAVSAEGTIWCWGGNAFGQLGDDDPAGRLLPAPVAGLAGASDVAAGSDATCALMGDGTVWCWGSDDHGQLGDGSGTAPVGPVQVFGLGGVKQLAAHWQHVCALRDDESLWCWGNNSLGQLGDGTNTDQPRPVRVAGLDQVTDVSTGLQHTCASTRALGLWCWGDNSAGQLAQSDGASQSRPVTVASIPDPIAVAVGAAHSCAVRKDGGAWCWGNNLYGQLGEGTTSSFNVPVPVSGFTQVVEMAAGGTFTCGRRDEGTVWCWGDDHLGQLGNGSAVVREAPLQVPLSSAAASPIAVDVAAGGAHTCAVMMDWSVLCWGSDQAGQLGDHDTVDRSTPAAIKLPLEADEIVAGAAHTCARTHDPETTLDAGVWCWGRGSSGQIGPSSLVDTSLPTVALPPEAGQVSQLAAGDAHTCALLAGGGSVLCWGDNGDGQLGDGTTTDRAQPAAVGALGGVAAVAAGGAHTCALLTGDGTVWCWGADDFGQLGDGGTASQSLPAQAMLPGGGGPVLAIAVAAGGQHTCALDAGGLVSCWGRGDAGQLGGGAAVTSAAPSPVNGLGGAVATAIAAGSAHSCALTGDGRVWCWGANDTGQLGDGTTTPRSTAVQVQGLTEAVQVTAGAGHTCARRKDGSLWCWGANLSGELGDGVALQLGTPQLERLICP